MHEKGVVSKTSGNIAFIEMQRRPGCGKCNACVAMTDGSFRLEAINDLGAREGDTVEIEVPSYDVLRSSAIVYLVPVAALFAGFFAGEAVFKSEIAGVLSGLLLSGVSVLLVALYDRKVKQKEGPKARVVSVPLESSDMP